MRIALISDIHGNDTALQAVLSDIEERQVDSIICLGDVATIAPQPKEVLARLRETECLYIMGNHDAALLDPDAAAQYQIARPLIPSLHWCARQLTAEDFAFLRSFAPIKEVSLDARTTLLCCHGSPQSNTDIILATTPADELDRLLGSHSATIIAGGHTHIRMLRRHNGKLIINPGSAGMPFLNTPLPGEAPTLLPWSEYAILTLVKGALSIDFRQVLFDLHEFIKAISVSDIPIKEWLIEQYSSSHTE